MAKQDLGIKRLCPNCGAKYYDLNKQPPVCPKCGTVFVVATAKSRPAEPPPPPKEEEAEIVAEPVADTISLEEADEEASGAKPNSGDEDEDEDIEVEGDDDDDAFLEEDEDEGDDVTDIIGDVDDEDD